MPLTYNSSGVASVVARHLNVDIDLIMMELCALFPLEWLRDKAKETGLIKRERKIDPVYMFWSLSISYGTFLECTPPSGQ